jgi:S1-C subfamily serine protease
LPLLASAAVVALAVIGAVEGLGTASPPPTLHTPEVAVLPTSAKDVLQAEPLELSKDAATRRAEMMTLRVRNISCAGESVGSGFAVNPHTLITNRHVLAGAAVLQMNTWDGTSIEGDVNTSATGRLVDIGVTVVGKKLPAVAQLGPAPKVGDRVTAVGYPLGGALTLSSGRVLRYLDGRSLDPSIAFDGQVIEVSARIKHGNSGGPLLDARGRVVGVIYAGEPGPTTEAYMRVAYAIPVSSLKTVLSGGDDQVVIPCEQ